MHSASFYCAEAGTMSSVDYLWSQTAAEVSIVVSIPIRNVVYKRDVVFKVTKETGCRGLLRLDDTSETVASIALTVRGKVMMAGRHSFRLGGPIDLEAAEFACTVRRNRRNETDALIITVEKERIKSGGTARQRRWAHCFLGDGHCEVVLPVQQLEVVDVVPNSPPTSPPASPQKLLSRANALLLRGPSTVSILDLSDDTIAEILVLAIQSESEDCETQSKAGCRLSEVCTTFRLALQKPQIDMCDKDWHSCIVCGSDLQTAAGPLRWTDEMPFPATDAFAQVFPLFLLSYLSISISPS